MIRSCLALLASMVLLWAAPARAITVAVVRAPNPTREASEALSRLQGELLSVGLDVRLLERPTGGGPGSALSRAWLDELASADVDAVVEIGDDVAPMAVDVWVLEESPRRWVVTRVALPPDTRSAPARLAIRAVEFVRASLLEHDMTARERYGGPSEEPPTTALAVPSEPQPRPERIGVELGVAALVGLDGVGPALLPLARLDWVAHPRFVVQAALTGAGSRPTIASAAGDARIAQQYGTLGSSVRLHQSRRWRVFVALASGAMHTSVVGHAQPPGEGHTVDQWSLMVEGSAGAGLLLLDRLSLTLATHLQVAEPYVAIHFEDEVVATSGRPNLAFTLAIGAWP